MTLSTTSVDMSLDNDLSEIFGRTRNMKDSASSGIKLNEAYDSELESKLRTKWNLNLNSSSLRESDPRGVRVIERACLSCHIHPSKGTRAARAITPSTVHNTQSPVTDHTPKSEALPSLDSPNLSCY